MDNLSTTLASLITMYESGLSPQDLLQSIFENESNSKYNLPQNPTEYFIQQQAQIELLLARGASIAELKLSATNIICLTADLIIYLVERGLTANSLYHYYLWRPHVSNTQLLEEEAMKIANYITNRNITVPLSYLFAAFKNNAPSQFINLLLQQATKLDQILDFPALQKEIVALDLLSSNLDALQFYSAEIKTLLKKDLGKGGIFFHYIVKANHLPYLKTIVNSRNFNLNALNQSGQNALFFAESPEIIQFLLESGADTSIIDVNGHNWLNLPSLETINFLIENHHLTKTSAEMISYNHLIRGNFEHAAKLLKAADLKITNPLDLFSAAIENAITNSSERNIFHAIANLIAKAGINIHSLHHHLVNSIDDNINAKDFTFIIGLIPRLAEHYLNLVKSNITDLELFTAAMNLLDSDFAIEVLTINGEVPTLIMNDITTFRGLKGNVDESDINAWFQYGIRAFSSGKYQKFLGFYSNTPWNQSDGKWHYGGTYVTLDPAIATHYALGGTSHAHAESILIEINIPKGDPQVCGYIQSMLELVPANIIGANIIAVYKLNKVFENGQERVRIGEVYTNPHTVTHTPEYRIGDQVTPKNESDNLYNSLNCFPSSNGTSTSNKYTSYDDFKLNYKEEQHINDQNFIWDNFFASRKLYDPLLPFGIILEDSCDSALYCC